jgi:hypothetical protein
MSQFTINGITFEDDKDSLQHGLGVGGGRGRPKGSRNGYINPNAAYMKGYEIKGEVAQPVLGAGNGIERPNAMGAGSQIGRSSSIASRVTKPTSAPRISVQSRRNSGGGSGGSTTRNNTVAGAARNATVNNMVDDIDNVGNLEGSNDSKRVGSLGGSSTPATSVQNGKSFLEKALGATTQAVVDTGDFVRDNVIKPAEQLWNGTDKQIPGSKGVPAGLTNAYQQGTPDVPSTTEHTKGARETIEESLAGAGDTAKEWWDGFLKWGEQAWKDVSETATSAINTGKGWAKSGFDWVNNNIINPVGKWGETAVSDVGNWIGERGRELDRWWNGYDVPAGQTTSMWQGGHVNGFRENAANWLDQAGQDVGRAANNWWNGYETGNGTFRAYHPGMRDMLVGNNERGVSGMLNDPIGFTNQQLVEPIFGQNGVDEWSRDVSQNVGNWVGDLGRDIAAVPGQVSNWLGDRGRDFNRWMNGYYSVTPSEVRTQGDIKGNTQQRNKQYVNGFLDNAGQFIQKVRDTAGNVRDAVVDGYGRIIGFVETLPTHVNYKYHDYDIPDVSENTSSAVPEQNIQQVRDTAGNVRDAVVDDYGRIIDAQANNGAQGARVNMSSAANMAREAGLGQTVINGLIDAMQNGNGHLSEEGVTNLLNEYAAGFTSEAEIRKIIDEVRNGK